MYRLHFQGNRRSGRRLLVREARVTLGSGEGCELRVSPGACPVERLFELEEGEGGVKLRRLEGEIEVKLNGAEAGAETLLRHGDAVEVGGIRMEYEEIIPPTEGPRKPTAGVLQVMTVLAMGLVLALEAGLFGYTLDWQGHIITQNSENVEKAVAERARVMKEAEEALNPKAETTADGRGKVVVMDILGDGEAGEGEVPEAVRAALGDADFAPAALGDAEAVPEAGAYDSATDSLQRLLQEAETAANFADYPRAFRLLDQIHQKAPGYLDAYRTHARLLEERGDLEAAYQRWTQLVGLAGGDAGLKAEAQKARQVLRNRRQLQKKTFAQGVDRAALPRQIQLGGLEIQKLPADDEIAEMRMLRGWIEAPAGCTADLGKPLTLHLTFFDMDAGGRPVATRFLTTPSPMAITRPLTAGGRVTFEATYIVPAARDARTQAVLPFESLYYGYALHLFLGDELQDAAATPMKLLGMPLDAGGEAP